jgi:hypothetical protein
MRHDIFALLAAVTSRTRMIVLNPHDVGDMHVARNVIGQAVSAMCPDDPARAARIAECAAMLEARVRTIGTGRLAPWAFTGLRLPGHDELARAFASLREERRLLAALPFTAGAVAALLATIRRRREQRFIIERTRISDAFFADVSSRERGSRVELASASRLVSAAKRGEEAWLVTFPDHHRAPASVCRMMPFLGSDHDVPFLEPLLVARGYAPLVTLAHSDGAARVAVRTPDALDEGDLAIIMSDVLRDTDSFVRAHPETLLSWTAVRDRRHESGLRRTDLEIRAARGFLRAWQSAETDANVRSRIDAILPQLTNDGGSTS